MVRSGPARVVDAGLVTTFAGHSLSLAPDVGGDRLRIELEFDDDADDLSPRVAAQEVPFGWRLRCTNFTDGRGSAEPILMGEIGDDLLFLHLRVFRYGQTADRTVHYTVYRAAKVDVGWIPDLPGS